MGDQLFPIDWNAFHFLRPQFLWGLMAVAVFLLVGLLTMRKEVKWKEIIAPHLRGFVIRKGNEWIKSVMHVASCVGLCIGILALAGPTWKKKELPGKQLETPVVILLDMSLSMMAEDLQPTRLERAKFKIHDLLKFNPGARIALIGFAGTAHTIVPLTRDYEIIRSHLDGLKPYVMPFPGSDVQAALVLADTVMSVSDAPGYVLLFSDDYDEDIFNTVSQYTKAATSKIEIIPMNTAEGSDFPSLNGRGQWKDAQGHPVFSSLNESALQKFATIDRVTVHKLTLDNSDMEEISKTINTNLTYTDKPKEKKDDWDDEGWVLVIPVAVLLLLWFRKGWVVYVLVPLLLTSCSHVQMNSFEDLWFTEDYQGQRLSEQGKYKEAAEHYSDPMRKGVAYFKAGDYENAIDAFQNDTTAWGKFNLGLAYFNNGDTLAAQMAFGQAVEMDPTFSQARQNAQQLGHLSGGTEKLDPKKAQEAQKENQKGSAKNEQNTDMEDLSGGGQEATKKEMEKKRKEETVNTDIRKGKELDELPDNFDPGSKRQDNSKILMRKVDDDPALFLKRKFEYQVKKDKRKPNPDAKKY